MIQRPYSFWRPGTFYFCRLSAFYQVRRLQQTQMSLYRLLLPKQRSSCFQVFGDKESKTSRSCHSGDSSKNYRAESLRKFHSTLDLSEPLVISYRVEPGFNLHETEEPGVFRKSLFQQSDLFIILSDAPRERLHPWQWSCA